MRTLFFGTPALAVPYLSLLADATEVKAVVTTPDEPAGRGYALQASPVKQAAQKLQVPVFQPAQLKDPEFVSELSSFKPEVVIVVAYGKLIPPAVLKVPKYGFINVHFSLLPAHRGAAPIQRALMQGDTQTGVSLFWLEEGLDTGPLFWQKGLPIDGDDDAETLRQKLTALGLTGLQEVLSALSKDQVVRTPQDGKVSLAPSLKKEEGKIDWSHSAARVRNLIRGTNPWPGAFTFVNVNGKPHRLKILKAQVIKDPPWGAVARENGMIVDLVSGRGFVVKCTSDSLHILQVQPEGKRPMSAWDFWQGARLKQGEKLG